MPRVRSRAAPRVVSPVRANTRTRATTLTPSVTPGVGRTRLEPQSLRPPAYEHRQCDAAWELTDTV